MVNSLKRLIQKAQDVELIERLMDAIGMAERVVICEAFKGTLEFQEFLDQHEKAMASRPSSPTGLLSDGEFEITTNNVLEIMMIHIIAGINEEDTFDDYACATLEENILDVEGVRQAVSEGMIKFSFFNHISDCTLEEILGRIF